MNREARLLDRKGFTGAAQDLAAKASQEKLALQNEARLTGTSMIPNYNDVNAERAGSLAIRSAARSEIARQASYNDDGTIKETATAGSNLLNRQKLFNDMVSGIRTSSSENKINDATSPLNTFKNRASKLGIAERDYTRVLSSLLDKYKPKPVPSGKKESGASMP